MAQTSPDQTLQLNHKTTQNSKKPALLAEGLNTCAKGKWHLRERYGPGSTMFRRRMLVYFSYFHINFHAFFE